MKILVLNCGSSSIKYKLFDMASGNVMAQGGIEKIGLTFPVVSGYAVHIRGEIQLLESYVAEI